MVIDMTATDDCMKHERVGNAVLLIALFPKVCFYKWWAAPLRCRSHIGSFSCCFISPQPEDASAERNFFFR